MVKVCQKCYEVGVSLKLCSGCESVYYCSRNCQKSDWKAHKPNCKRESSVLELIEAVEANNQEKVIELSKNPNVINGREDYYGHKSVLKKWSAMHHCAMAKRPELARILLDAGANSDIKDDDKETPLFVTARS